MTTREKRLALQALGDLEVTWNDYRGEFHASCRNVEIGDGVTLLGAWEAGETADEAVDKYFRRVTNLQPNERLVRNGWRGGDRRELVWNGAAWKESPLLRKRAAA